MAQKKVIVKRLASIENLGSMNLLCSDKTGTLTEGELELHSFQDLQGNEIPYDFLRKRLSILVSKSGTNLMITKGALLDIIEICSLAEDSRKGKRNRYDLSRFPLLF